MEPIDIRQTSSFAKEGWTRHDLSRAVREGALQRVRRSIYAPPTDMDAEARYLRQIAAACERWHDDCAVSHVSAAVLHGIPVRRNVFDLIHLTRDGPGHGKVKAGVRLHRATLAAHEVTVIGGLRVTSLERTLADLARREPYEWGVVAADAVLRRQGNLELLQDYVDEGRRKPGNGRLRAVLAFADARSESALESMSRVSMARAGVPMPVLQRQITDPGGGWIATGDFAWEDVRVIGEADGRAKYTGDDTGKESADVIMAEKTRDQALVRAGWRPTHWGWDLATNHVALGQHLRAVFSDAA